MTNWSHDTDHWMPIETLAPSYKGPLVFANEDRTVIWFSEHGDRSQIENHEHEREEGTNLFLYDGDKPRTKKSLVKPAFWALARITD